MHAYRTHTCNQLRAEHKGQTVKISGWIHRKRDHGGLLFVDLRDHYGLTQCVINTDNPMFPAFEKLRLENVVSITGEVVARTPETVNKHLPTGEIEVKLKTFDLLSAPVTDMLPLQVNTDEPYGEEVRLRYRFLDLRRDVLHRNIVLRCDVISSLRRRMIEQGFLEFQTPILTASSPEGARDFLVPSRLHPGKFYALPQAPQQFKQLLMMSGFDKYFQIAPCFRDEDARADRTAGEFYQLDVERSFVTQDDIFATMEPVIYGVFEEFSNFTGKKFEVSKPPFVRIPYDESMLKYGNDKPDLRNPLVITDVTSVFKRDDVTFNAFKSVLEKGGVVRAIRAPKVSDRPRSFFDKLNDWAKGEGAVGLGYVVFEGAEGKGPIAKFIPAAAQEELKKLTGAGSGDAVFFVCDMVEKAAPFAGKARTKIAEEMDIIDKHKFIFSWIVDFPMYEINEKTGKVDFSHNPFSMPAGGLHALNTQDPLKIKAYQYDCVLNGIELASGGIRNHVPEIMERAFDIAGYPKGEVETKFGGMYNAFKFGAPPHGGCAFGIDRMVMFLADQKNVREVIAFPMNQQAEDLLMNAPTTVEPNLLKDVHIKMDLPKAQIKAAG
ncbi:MAG: aspartate--tRNA ligase [Alphaproteobacteria bacterium]|nr:aspartate--tRNA ligase [Alphaproteobacteria bacterium]